MTASHTFEFYDVNVKPIPSLFRNFSAPVKVRYSHATEDLPLLFKHDKDALIAGKPGNIIVYNSPLN